MDKKILNEFVTNAAVMKLVMNLEIEIKTILNRIEERLEVLERTQVEEED